MSPPNPAPKPPPLDRAMQYLGLSPRGSRSTSQLNLQRPGSSLSQRSGSTANLPGTAAAATPAGSDNEASASASSSLGGVFSSIWKGRRPKTGPIFKGTKEVLRVIKETTDFFPPVKSAAAALYEILNILDTADGNREEVKKLQNRLKVLEEILSSCPPSGVERSLEDRLGGLARMLEEKAAYLKGKLNDSKGKRVINATEDQKEIHQAIEEVRFAIEIAMLDISISGRKATLEVVKEVAWVKKRVVETRNLVEETKEIAIWLKDNEHLKKIKTVTGAEFNQEDRQGCIPGTRVALLATLLRWAKDPSSPSIFWLCGMAGTGKTTLTETFNVRLDDQGVLVASFFCSLDHVERRDVRRIIPSLAKSLAKVQPKFAKQLVKVLESGKVPDDPVALNLKDQYRILILEPASKAFDAAMLVALSIDALDECSDKEAIRLLLKAILSQPPPPPLKVFLTSRPEDHLEERFASYDTHRQLLLHDVEQHIVQADIAVYLRHCLSQIGDLKGHVQEKDVENLAERSQNLFIYAATLVKYLDEYRGDRLRLFRELCSSDSTSAGRLDSLYKLYGVIMSEAFKGLEDTDTKTIQACLSLLIVAPNPLSVSGYAGFLGLDRGAVRSAFRQLHSVVRVPREDLQPITILHASFADYLTTDNSHRRHEWAIDRCTANETAARRCFIVMNKELRIGISGATTSYKSNDEQPKPLCIPPGLAYACTAWINHVLDMAGMTGCLLDELQEQMDGFLVMQSLYWLEVLSVEKKVDYAYNTLPLVPKALPALPRGIKDHLIAIATFSSRFRTPISESAPHLYLSALPAYIASGSSPWFYPQIPAIPRLSYSYDRRQLWTSDAGWRVGCIAYSPDGTLLASGLDDCTIRLWNPQTGEALDGTLLASGSWDNTIHLWNPQTGEALDGTLLASGSYDGTIRLWNPQTGKALDGTLLASGLDDCTIRLWNPQTGEALGGPLKGHSAQVTSVAFSPDGTLLASGSWDNTIRLWNPQTGEALGEPLQDHSAAVTSVAFSPDGTLLASGSWDTTIRLWNPQTGDALGEPLQGHSNWVTSVAFSPDGTLLASGSWDNTIRLWNPQTGEALGGTLLASGSHDGTIRLWGPQTGGALEGTLLASGSYDNTIRLWNPQTGEALGEPLQGHSHQVTSVAFSPDGTLLASGSHDGTIRLWGPQTGGALDGTLLASGSWDNTIRLWNPQTGEALGEPLQGHSVVVTSVAFSPNGTLLASGSHDATIRLWSPQTGEALDGTLLASGSYDHTIRLWNPQTGEALDGTLLASGSYDGTIRLWNSQTGEALGEPLQGHSRWVASVVFSPDGTLLASGSYDSTIRLWKPQTGEALGGPLQGHSGAVASVAFSPEGTLLASGSYDNTIRLCGPQTVGALGEPLQGHSDGVTSVAFSPDGTLLASGSWDTTIRLWSPQTGEALGEPLQGHSGQVTSVAFSPDGTLLASGLYDGTIRLWNPQTGKALDGTLLASGSWDTTIRLWSPQTGEALDGTLLASGSHDNTIRLWNTAHYQHSHLQHFDSSNFQDQVLFQMYPHSICINMKDGWIRNAAGDLLFWALPRDRRNLISPLQRWKTHDYCKLDLTNAVHGTEWTKCQEPRPPGARPQLWPIE
ncbi:NB-ARC [Coprinopsis cinerea okayama7|uniref:NB-ARC n=1 Tax=Coprinopsis cinerea (strain Okayama-7 / 130 / ATCC MYA-4618 / FGSC 9003) TaxID=240176 RepID=A8N0C0_COPC7|nr:NB-ARC [Coprinopsis cinerea okayama7\|eukprot:XP_001828317.2 NB-ARC [Coprinopsis cinerea okayama7\